MIHALEYLHYIRDIPAERVAVILYDAARIKAQEPELRSQLAHHYSEPLCALEQELFAKLMSNVDGLV